jgi:hypothetical protein
MPKEVGAEVDTTHPPDVGHVLRRNVSTAGSRILRAPLTRYVDRNRSASASV